MFQEKKGVTTKKEQPQRHKIEPENGCCYYIGCAEPKHEFDRVRSKIGRSIHACIAVMHPVKTPYQGNYMSRPVKPVIDKIKHHNTQNQF